MIQRCSLTGALLAAGILSACSAESPPEEVRSVQQRLWTNNWEPVPGALPAEGAGAGVAVWMGTYLDAYFRDTTTNHLMTTSYYYPTGQWSSAPYPLGDTMTLDPTVLTTSDGSEHIFYRRSGAVLMHKQWSIGGGWGVSENLGGYLTSAPAAVNWQDTYEDVFYRGGGGRLKHRRAWYGDGQWTVEEDLGGIMTGAPAVAYNPNYDEPREEVYYRNASGGIDVIITWGTGGGSAPATWLSGANMYAGSHPSAAVMGNTTYVFWRDADSHLKYARYGVDTAPSELETYVYGSPAAAARWDRIDVLVRGTFLLMHRVWQESFHVGLIPQEQQRWCYAAVGEMISKYLQHWVHQCVWVNSNTGQSICCDDPTNTLCDKMGIPDWWVMGFHSESTASGTTMTKQQIESEVVAHRPWAHLSGDPAHWVVGVDRLVFYGTFWVGINDPWPPTEGDQYLETWSVYNTYVQHDDFHIWWPR